MKTDEFFNTSNINAQRYKENKELQGELVIVDAIPVEMGNGRKLVLHFSNVPDTLPLNVTNLKALNKALGKETTLWTGAKITLGIEPVEYNGDIVDGLRIKSIIPAQ